MEDSEIQDAMEALREEATAWKKKFKSMELKKRESDLALNKIKTEINSLRSVDKLWKESAKTVYVNLSDVKHQFDCQVQQVLDGLAGLSKAGQRVSEKLPYMRRIKATIAAMQKRIALQDETIVSLNNKLRVLGAELVEKNKKIERLSEGIDEEVERLVKPMRDRLADSMLQVMKEKAARAQERRELADLWPADQLLPTILMRYRALSDDERIRRCKIATERNASMALSLEIRSNVAESKMWETKYDDYGRTFYQHMSTGETSWEVPDIMNYKPPPGRDEMGNIVITEENDMNNFFFRSDNHGEVYYENRNTGEVSFIPPCAYKKIPVGKPRKVLVAEAAALVLSYIKEKISLHIQKMNKIKHVLENPLTIEERTKKEKALRNRPSQEEDELVESNDDNNIDDLSAFQYDIETVEFLADTLNESQIKGNADKDPVPFRSDRRLFLQDAAVRSFDVDNYGPTILETDLNGITTSKLRKIVEDLAICEEKLERKLQRSRNNLKDFSFKLMEMLVEEKKARTEKMELEREAKIQHDKEMRRKLMEERKTVAEAEKMRKFQELEHTVNLGEAGKILAPDIDIVGCDGDVGLDTAIDTFSLNELPTDNPKNIDKNDGLQQKSLSSAKLSDGLKSAELNDVDSILQVNIDERESQESAEDTDEESNISNADLESILSANTAKFSTSGEHLFGLTNVEYLQFGESHPESLIVLCKKLSNFALFCGYNNLRMENFTDDSNKCYSFVADAVEYETTGYGSRSVANGSLQSRSTGRSRDNNSNVNTETLGDSTRNTSEGPHQESDDEWLTCSFFLMLNKDMLDKIADKNSNLSAHVVSTFGFDFQSKPYTYVSSTVDAGLQQSYHLWKAKQLIADVLKVQLRQKAVSEALSRRIAPLAGTEQSRNLHFIRNVRQRSQFVELKLKNLTFKRDKILNGISPSLYFLQITIGSWMTRTDSQHPAESDLLWNYDAPVVGHITLNDIQLSELVIELFDEQVIDDDAASVAFGSSMIDKILGCNCGNFISISMDIFGRKNKKLGTIQFEVCADMVNDHFFVSSDPNGLERLEINFIDSEDRDIKVTKLDDSIKEGNRYAYTNFSSLGRLVGLFRGDGIQGIHPSIENKIVDESNILDIPLEEIVKPLPNFENATLFLVRKENYFSTEIDGVQREIENIYETYDTELTVTYETMMKAGYEVKVRYQKLLESEKELKKELLLLQKQVNDNKKSIPMPKEPVFDELQPVSYVPKIPTIGMMDNRGKKKKQVPTADFKNILDAVDAGDMDGQDTWTFPENTWPSQAQQLKLGKVITMRNSILDVEREHLLSNREQQEELFKLEMDKWDIAEKQRRNDLEKIKLALRKQYLRYDCFLERANRINAETNLSDSTLKTIVDLRNQHVFAKDSYKMMKIKQYMERERQTKLIEQLTARLLKAIKARSVAMYLPSTARSRIDFAHLQNQSEEALRVLRYELLDCKQLLIDEGIRLRSLHYEELIFCQNELTRLKTSKEILFQRSCMDQILSRYKLEVINFMQQQEKAFLREAEVDFVGVDTIDELGERYRKDKEWKSSEVIKCTKLVEIALAKIALTEGLGQSAMESQRRMINLLTTKYGTEYLAVRDTWIENSDYDRSKMLVRDVSEWIRVEIRKLEDRERQVNCEKELLQQQFDISQQQRLVDFRNHENETAVLRSSSDEVVCVMRSHLYNLRKETKMKISNLESSITRLSRECQKVREDLLAQEIVYEEKLKVLWAFIHTLQTTVQQLSVRMEIILEEREQMVISSKLLADKMRFQLRVERRHCSNLMFIIHAQRGISKYLQDVIHRLNQKSKKNELEQKNEKNQLQKEIWEQVFTFTRLCTDVDALFEFFAARLANLAGSREAINNSLATNGAAAVLAALCKSPRSIVRKFASRALGGMGWNGYVETRILLWDSVMYWKIYKQKVIEREFEEYRIGLENFYENGKFESILNIRGDSEEFEPSANMSLRTLIKQRRQWALRATRRNEGPNEANQRLINIKDGVIPALLQMSLTDGEHDWEIARNAALAISIASYEEKNHHDIISSTFCVELIVKMCLREDPEVKTHAAIIIANLCHNDETAQTVFGQSGAIPVLLSMCETAIVDVLEASSSALANLTCFSDANCKTVIDSNGVAVMIKLITQSYSENLLDLDQNDEVQANAAELFANVSRYMTDYTAIFFDSAAIDVVVLMCASPNKKLRRNIPLVMGNIGHNESCRHMIGVKGGIEALFLILEDHDNTVKANALWALCNLMWHPPNQERAGRFISEIVNSLRSDWDPVRTNGCTLLANVLFYNTQNRIRFLEIDYAMELILDIIVDKKDQSMVEGCLRALLSLSYLDYVALWLGTVGECIPIFVDFLRPPFFTRESLRFSLEIICNLCLHHANRRALFDIGGLELIVSLHVDEDKHIRDLSLKIVEYLEDITPPEVLAQIKMEVGLERMVSLATNTDPLVRAVAVESIGEEIWRDPRKRERAQEIGAVDVMLGIVANSDEPVESLLPTLWSLRNVLSENLNAKSQFGYRDGCSIVANILRSCLLGQYREQSEKIFEAALLCLSTAVLHHERNARKLLLFGLEVVLELADGKASNPTYRQADSFVRIGMRSEGVISLAKSLLLLLAPYNYVICRNCHRKQELHGTSCFKCGYRLLIDIEEESARLLETK